MPNEEEKSKEQFYTGSYRKVVEGMLRGLGSAQASVTPRSFYDFDMTDIDPPVRGAPNAKP